MTGLEPATSRPPAVRATNCATPRYIYLTTNVEFAVGLRSPLATPQVHCCQHSRHRNIALQPATGGLHPSRTLLRTALHPDTFILPLTSSLLWAYGHLWRPLVSIIVLGANLISPEKDSRWVPARANHGLRQILGSHMISIQIIIYWPLRKSEPTQHSQYSAKHVLVTA